MDNSLVENLIYKTIWLRQVILWIWWISYLPW